MRNKFVRIIAALMLAVFCTASFTIAARADQVNKVVSLGANLNDQQKNEMLALFGVDKDDVQILEVTNAEERAYLEGLVSKEKSAPGPYLLHTLRYWKKAQAFQLRPAI